MKRQRTQLDYWTELAALPIHNPERNKLRDVVRVEGDALARRAHRFLSLATEYNERARRDKERAEGLDRWTYERWLRTFMRPADVTATLAANRAKGHEGPAHLYETEQRT